MTLYLMEVFELGGKEISRKTMWLMSHSRHTPNNPAQMSHLTPRYTQSTPKNAPNNPAQMSHFTGKENESESLSGSWSSVEGKLHV